MSNVRDFVEWAAVKLEVKELSDWHGVTMAQFIQVGGGSLLSKYKSLSHLLVKLYPFHAWDRDAFTSSAKSSNLLLTNLKNIPFFSKHQNSIVMNDLS